MSTPPQTPPDRPGRRDPVEDPTGIRALLAGLPDPGPMPPDLVDRINASLASEQLNRAPDHTVVPLVARRRRWGRIGLVAAAAAVVAVGIPALLTGTGAGDVTALLTREQRSESASAAKGAAVADSSGTTAHSPSSGTASSTAGTMRSSAAAGALDVVIYTSGTAYVGASLRAQFQAFVAHPGTPVLPMAAESPALGPVATAAGLQPCLRAIGVTAGDRVAADLATYNGSPAVVVVVSRATGREGYVLRRECATEPTAPLVGAVPLG